MAEPLTQTSITGVIPHPNEAAHTSSGWGFLFGSVVLSSAAQVLLKAGAMVGNGDRAEGVMSNTVSLFTQPAVVIGLVLYGLGTLMWLKCLSRLDLGLAYLVSALQYILVFVAARIVFGETLSATRCLGLGVILVGIVIVSRPRKS